MRFYFRWDQSGDGNINQSELEDVISAIVSFLVLNQNEKKMLFVQYDYTGIVNRKGENDPKKRAKAIIQKLDINRNKKISKEEFITGYRSFSIR